MYMRELMTVRNCTVWMYWEWRIGERTISWMFCVTLKRVLLEGMMEGMRLVFLGYRELH